MSLDLSGFIRKKTIIKIGTENFTFSEITLGDIARFKAHLKTERKKLNEERRTRLLADAEKIKDIQPLELLRMTDVSMTDEEVEREIETLDGICFLAQLSLSRTHENINLDNVKDILTPAVIEKVTDAMFPISEEDKKITANKKKLKALNKSQKQRQ